MSTPLPSTTTRPMTKARRLLILLGVLLACVVLDQITKSIAQQTLSARPPQEFLGGIFRLEYIENPGAFLSLGATLSPNARFWIFTVVVVLLLAGLLIFAVRMSDHTPVLIVVAIALVVGGGVSNLIDRLVNEGRVVDYMQLGIGPLRTGIFNVADVAIMGGLALMVVAMWRDGKTGNVTSTA
jgi:signal peptidase II